MKLKYLVIILLIFNSCGQPEKISLDKLVLYAGGYKYQGELYSGAIEDVNSMGTTTKGGMLGGKKNGLWVVVNKRNDTIKKTNYIAGQINGNVQEFRLFDKVNRLYRTTQFWKDSDTNLMNSEETTYDYRSGSEQFIVSQGKMEGSVKYGAWHYYSDKDKKSNNVIYLNGILDGVANEIFSDYMVKGRYRDGKKDGVWITFFQGKEKNRIDTLRKYRKGKEVQKLFRKPNELSLKYIKTSQGLEYLCNTNKNYYDKNLKLTNQDNAEFYRVNYTWGILDSQVGNVEDYYMNGNLRFIGEITNLDVNDAKRGNKHGICIWYFENGKKQIEAEYHSGHIVGKSVFFNQDGTVNRTEQNAIVVASSNNKDKYISDGTKCTNCKSGIYYSGICNSCNSASVDRTLESYSKLQKCNLCNGSGFEKSRTNENRARLCFQCKGVGKIIY